MNLVNPRVLLPPPVPPEMMRALTVMPTPLFLLSRCLATLRPPQSLPVPLLKLEIEQVEFVSEVIDFRPKVLFLLAYRPPSVLVDSDPLPHTLTQRRISLMFPVLPKANVARLLPTSPVLHRLSDLTAGAEVITAALV